MTFRRKKIIISKEVKFLYNNLKNHYKTGEYLDEVLLESGIKNYYGISYDSEFNSIIKSPFIVAMAIQDNINKNRDLIKDIGIHFLKSEEQALTRKYISPKCDYIRVRLLNNDNQGLIPRNDFIFNDMVYTFIEDTPLIMTKVVDKDEIEKLEFNEFNELQTKELKFLTALTFLNICPCNTFQLNIKKGFISIPMFSTTNEKEFQNSEIIKVRLIIKLISKLNHSYYNIVFKNNGSNYHTEDKQLQRRLMLFLKQYDEENEVLKRSSYLLYKSNILFHDRSNLFQEEAYTFLTIALEGLLKLIAVKKFGKFDKKEIFNYICRTIKNGEYISNRLADIYESRTELVHPINDYDVSWNKNISYDDFIEDMDIAKILLYFYVTDNELEILDI